jgi:hypothetical protein
MKRSQRFHCEKARMFNQFVDEGIRSMNRSEALTWTVLFRDMQDTGLSQTSRSEIVRRGGMSPAQATRAIQSLVSRKLVVRVCEGFPGKASLYTLFEVGELVKFSPAAKALIEKYSQKKRLIDAAQSGAKMTPVSAAPVS